MNAIISSRSGIAMILDGDRVMSLRAGTGEQPSASHLEDFPYLFGDAGDLRFIEDIELPVLADMLATECAKELALQLALVLLDRGFSARTRQAAGKELEALLRGEEVEYFVESVLYAHVLPLAADLIGALSSIPGDALRVKKFLESLRAHQTHIAAVQMAWEVLPGERTLLRAKAIRAGWFRSLAMWRARGGQSSPPLMDLEDQSSGENQRLARHWIEELRRAGSEAYTTGDPQETSADRMWSYVAERIGSLDRPEGIIFLSYDWKDKEKVELVYDKLVGAGFRPWMDTRDVVGGQLWRPSIEQAIRSSDFLLICLSKRSARKGSFFQKQVRDALAVWRDKLALAEKVPLIPVRLEDCSVPESLSSFQWVDLFESNGWAELMRALEARAVRRLRSS